MTHASLTASLLARKGNARPAGLIPGSFKVYEGTGAASIPQAERTHTQTAPQQHDAACLQAQKMRHTGPTTRKSVTMPKSLDRDLRVLAARRGISQQTLVAEILSGHLAHLYDTQGCICGAVSKE